MIEQFLHNITMGLGVALEGTNLVWVAIGVAWGIVGGALPGVSASTSMALFIPASYYMDDKTALMMLCAILIGAHFGNSLPAIFIRTPGTPSAVLIVVEGHPLHLAGKGGKAAGISLVSAVLSQFISILVLIAVVVPFSAIAVKFLFPEMFALAVFGLAAAASLTGKSVIKGATAALFGVALAMVGADPITGQSRFSFGTRELSFGLDTIAVLMGLLAVSEVLRASRQLIPWSGQAAKASKALPTWSEIRDNLRAIFIGTGLGFVVGAMPGAGSTAGTFIVYGEMKRWAKHPELWGKGSMEAVAAIDAADNAVVQGALVPTLGIGIPGSVPTAIFLAAMILHGIEPGPLLMSKQPDLVYALFGGLLTGSAMLLILGWLSIYPSVRIATLSRPAVMVTTLALVTVGVFSVNWLAFDILVCWIFGVIGYFMYKYGYSPAACVLGLVLGEIIEMNLRRGLMIGYGDFVQGFLMRPVTAFMLAVAVLTFLYPLIMPRIRKARAKPETGALEE